MPHRLRCLALAARLLPVAAQAQLFNKFEPGSCVLAGTPPQRLTGQLKLREGGQLLVKEATGNTRKLAPGQVVSFQLGTRKYLATTGIHGNDGFGSLDSVKTFVEMVDSGRVLLLRHTYQQGTPGFRGSNGMMMGGGAIKVEVYLLQWPGEAAAVPVAGPEFAKGRLSFADTVRPFFLSHPDLLRYLDAQLIDSNNLPQAIRALNHGTPFHPAPSVLNQE